MIPTSDKKVCGGMETVVIARVEIKHALVQFVSGVVFHVLDVLWGKLMILDAGQQLSQTIVLPFQKHTFVSDDFT